MRGPSASRFRIPARLRWLAVQMACCCLLSGCISSPYDRDARPDYDPSLISGERLFDQPLAEDEAARVDVLEVSAAMRELVDSHVRRSALARKRFQGLLEGMAASGLTTPDYNADRTLTAAETFQAGTGNCLSFTNLFIALAREAELDAVYQVVEVPPDWDAESGFLIRYTHVNVLVRNVRLDQDYGNEVTVDFNQVNPAADFRRYVISDDYAESLFYANRAITLIRSGDPRRGFVYLRRAIEIAPQNIDLWINLGALYATQGDHKSSIEAYEVAVQIDPDSRAAMAGLARAHDKAGNAELARFYEDRVDDYLDKNPYYHYAIARTAFASEAYAQSLDAVERAISLNRRIGRFHFLKGLAEERLGRTDAARTSFRVAERLGLQSSAKLEYIRSFVGYNAH